MTILAFSDIHRDIDAANAIVTASSDADILVGAGDFATAGNGAREIVEIIAKANIPTVLVHGNHDNVRELKEVCNEWINVYLLHGQSVEIEGITFFGIGGEIPKLNDAEWNETVSEEDAAKMLYSCPVRSILVTHSPPFGCSYLQKDGTHEGSKAIYAAIEKNNPSSTSAAISIFSGGPKGK